MTGLSNTAFGNDGLCRIVLNYVLNFVFSFSEVNMPRFSSTAGIAIGPILFVIALLGILAAVAGAGMGSFGAATTADRVTADITTQANLIRSKINECNMQWLANNGLVNNASAPPFNSPAVCANDPYPCSDQSAGTAVTDLTCPGDSLDAGGNQQNMWTGPRNALLPPPTSGFTAWKYLNKETTSWRCIWTTNNNSNTGVGTGLAKAASKFSSQEASHINNGNSQKFIVCITLPSGSSCADCPVP